MLILFLFWTPVVACYQWYSYTFPIDSKTLPYSILKPDNATGCKCIFFPPESYYFYSDSCRQVPSDYGVQGSQILLRTTKIQTMRKGDFSGWYFVKNLRIEMNVALETLEPGAFSNLSSLGNLSISNNYQLRPLEDDIFQGLVNLKELRFVNNNLRKLENFIYSIRPEILPSLKVLDVSENSISYIKISDFFHMQGSKLEVIYFKLCNIVSIEAEAFALLTHLIALDFSNNNLNTNEITELLTSLNSTAANFSFFSLAANLLHKEPFDLLETVSKTTITCLDLKENHFDPLVPGSFPVMVNIKSLDLSGLRLVRLDNGTLDEYYLPNLKWLNLAKNHMTGIREGYLLPNVKQLDVSENTCETCLDSTLFNIGDNQLQAMTDLEILHIERNNIYHVRRYMFNGLTNLKALFLSNCTLYKIDLFAFETLTNLEHLDLSCNNLIMNYAISSQTFVGLESLVSLRLDYCGITTFSDPNTFQYLKSLKYLNLKHNYLVDFHPTLFSQMMNLAALDLSHNDILEWDSELFYENKNLTTIYLISNQIGEVTVSMLRDFSNMKFVDISENPFFCTCAAVEMVKSYLSTVPNSNQIDLNSLHLNDTKNVCFSPRHLGNTELIDYISQSIKTGYCTKYLMFITSVVMIVVVILLLLCVIAYYLRWHIRYWLFLFRQAMGSNYFPKRKNTPEDGKYKYDAFVSYSHEDRSFVIRLVAMMESQEPHFSLCVFERDFNVGGVITDNVCESLSASRRTIFILSDSFARSTWCLWEMKMVQHKWLFFKDNENEPLIIIKIGEIMDRHMTPTLRYLMKTRVYLQWNSDPKKQKIFWQKLRSALSRPTVK